MRSGGLRLLFTRLTRPFVMKQNPKTSQTQQNSSLPPQRQAWLYQLSAGVSLTSGLALAATFLHTLPGISIFSPLILAILLGILVRNTVGIPKICQLGVSFSLKRILRLAIILLGLQLSLAQVIEIGSIGLFTVASTLIGTFVFTCWLGKRLGVSKKLSQLIAAGISICGASAVIATNVAVDSNDEDVAYAVAIVTVFGTTSMLLYPVLSDPLHLTSQAFGIWCGSSIHEVAQVIAAAFQNGHLSGQTATISKLSRVILLAPTVLTLGLLSARSTTRGQRLDLRKVPIPWFVLCFVALILINSLNIFPEAPKAVVIQANQVLLAIYLAAIGLETNLYKLKQAGLKPFYLGAFSWLFISILSLGLIEVCYR